MGTQVREQVDVVAKMNTDRSTWIEIMLVLMLELLVGIVLAYLDMPAPMQPLHLLLGVLCFALVFYSGLRVQFRRA